MKNEKRVTIQDISKLEFFAAMALIGIIARNADDGNRTDRCKNAVKYALEISKSLKEAGIE